MKLTIVLAFAAILSSYTLVGCSKSENTSAEAPSVEAATVEASAVKSASFSGRSDHIVTGTASITGVTGSYELVLGADFELDGAPDPVVGFGNNGTYNSASKIAPLTQIKGAQRYSLPSDFNPAEAGEIYIWCEEFDVPLGVASFQTTGG